MEITIQNVHNYSLDTNIKDTILSVRVKNGLNNVGIMTLAHLLSADTRRIDRWRNFGKKSVDEVKHFINELQFLLPADAMLTPSAYLSANRIWVGRDGKIECKGNPRVVFYQVMTDYATYVKNFKSL